MANTKQHYIVSTSSEITGRVARQIRQDYGLSQRQFWGGIGVKQSIGCRYEAGLRVPEPIKLLIYIRYVAGIEHAPDTEEGAQALRQLAANGS